MNTKQKVHFTDKYLLHPTNPVTVNVIGAGGTGSQVLTALARMNQSLVTLGHAGLQVHVYDSDSVSRANLGRQLFAETELGINKGVALVNRLNRFFGTNWKAIPYRYMESNLHRFPEQGMASMTVTCVDTAPARFEIARLLSKVTDVDNHRNKPLYWFDYGNSQYTGQVILATVGKIPQPSSKKFKPIAQLPFVTEEYAALLQQSAEDDTPSCSLAEALTKQDLFINSTLANMGASLLWQLFREGMIYNRGFFLNLKDFRTQPLPIS